LEGRLPVYKPRGKNVIQEILQDHFKSFEENYDTQYSKKYGKYRIIHIKETVERFIECGDYSKGIARIKCTNTHCKHEYFRPFIASLKGACKSWYLCPSCDPQDVGSAGEDRMSKSLLTRKGFCFSRSTSGENVLLRLPHRQFVFTVPKLLRPYFKYDKNLFEEVSKIIFSIIRDFYNGIGKTTIKTGIIVSYQPFGDLLRFNPHYHCIVLEGGIDETGSFHHIPLQDTSNLTEVFRRRVIQLFVKKVCSIAVLR